MSTPIHDKSPQQIRNGMELPQPDKGIYKNQMIQKQRALYLTSFLMVKDLGDDIIDHRQTIH